MFIYGIEYWSLCPPTKFFAIFQMKGESNMILEWQKWLLATKRAFSKILMLFSYVVESGFDKPKIVVRGSV